MAGLYHPHLTRFSDKYHEIFPRLILTGRLILFRTIFPPLLTHPQIGVKFAAMYRLPRPKRMVHERLFGKVISIISEIRESLQAALFFYFLYLTLRP